MDVHSLPLEIRITCTRLALGTWYKALSLPEKEHKGKMKDVYDFIAKGNVHADGAILPFYWRLPPEEALTLSYPEKNVYWREVWSEDNCAWNGHYASYNYCKFNAIPLCERARDEEEEVEAEQSMNIYCEAVEALPEKCRRVFIMRKVNGMRHKEIADHLGITVGAVEKHLHNGARSCRAYIICANSEGAAGDEENPSHSHSKRGLN